MSEREVIIGQVETPIGPFGAVLTPEGLGRLTFPGEPFEECGEWAARWGPDATLVRDDSRLGQLREELTAYLEGRLREFSIPVDLRGTPFQVEVWKALLSVGYGETRSYRQLAAAIGKLEAVRAVGAANGANPVPVIVPCHRIIGNDGKLVGYGGGLDMKRRLLELEGVLSPLIFPTPARGSAHAAP